ncbi:hypothetical protein KY309_03480 [Candidatus Woesearchaeota archaeon]|nr:hypothetical protein [Candidatus Woesearchaeota archaeon]MBW3016644.1 hypothetical protein [Candidatus Woesearchaeota archaeon]
MAKKKNLNGVLVPAGCLIGLGIGMIYGRPDVGVLIGLGCGFVAYFIASKFKS